jgi:hypothetical protein
MKDEDMRDRLDTIEENCLNINEKRKKEKKKEMLAKKDKFSDRMVNYTCNRKK